jgi:hypothetical protein
MLYLQAHGAGAGKSLWIKPERGDELFYDEPRPRSASNFPLALYQVSAPDPGPH